MLGQESSPGEAAQLAELVRAAKLEGLGPWMEFNACEPRGDWDVSKQLVPTRWVLTWRMVDGRKRAKARLVAKGYQDPDLR